MKPERESAPVDKTEAQGKQQPEAWSRHSRSNAQLSQQTHQKVLWQQIQSLREAALAHRRSADKSEGEEHELAYAVPDCAPCR
jgi:hypothetical protein